jgi:TatD DNase family protein
MFIDSHAHIDSLDFEPDRGAMLERAHLAQVERILAVASGTGSKAMDAVIRLVEEHPFLDLAVGLHPHEANSANNSSFDLIKKVASHSKVVA